MIARLKKTEHEFKVKRFCLTASSNQCHKAVIKDNRVTPVSFGCVYSDEEIPVPIPNTEVKLVSGDGTALLSVGE